MPWWYVAVWIVATLALTALAPKPRSQKPPGVGEVDAPTAGRGARNPRLVRHSSVAGPQCRLVGTYQDRGSEEKRWGQEMTIILKHVRQCHMCSRGAREFFGRHGLDWSEFVKNGLPEETILATGDAMAKRVVERAHGRG